MWRQLFKQVTARLLRVEQSTLYVLCCGSVHRSPHHEAGNVAQTHTPAHLQVMWLCAVPRDTGRLNGSPGWGTPKSSVPITPLGAAFCRKPQVTACMRKKGLGAVFKALRWGTRTCQAGTWGISETAWVPKVVPTHLFQAISLLV